MAHNEEEDWKQEHTAQVVERVVRELSDVEAHLVDAPEGVYGPADGGSVEVFSVPRGRSLVSVEKFLDEYRVRPERRKGSAHFTRLDSFVLHTVRYKDEHTAIFANQDPTSPGLVAVLDYHEKGAGGQPRFGEHRGHYGFPLSPEWQAWTTASNRRMTQKAFAEFIEGRLADIAMPTTLGTIASALAEQLGLEYATPSRLVTLAKGLTVREGATVRNHTNLSTGEAQIQYETVHTGEGGQPLTVPGAFCVNIPVFKGGAQYTIPVRLRYRLEATANSEQRSIQWFVDVYRPDLYFDHAFTDSCNQVEKDTGVTVLYGLPE